MTTWSELEMADLGRQLEVAYGSLDAPRYDFLKTSELRAIHMKIKAQLQASGCEVEDDTDENTDVCTYLVIQSDQGDIGCLLSLVAPYLAVTRNRGHRLLAEDDVAQLACGKLLLQLMENHQLRLLPPDLLEQEVPLRRVEDERAVSTVMEAFFYAP